MRLLATRRSYFPLLLEPDPEPDPLPVGFVLDALFAGELAPVLGEGLELPELSPGLEAPGPPLFPSPLDLLSPAPLPEPLPDSVPAEPFAPAPAPLFP